MWVRRYGFSAAVALILAGCQAPAPLNSAQAISLLATGQPVLKCTNACLVAWQRTQPEAARLNAAARWPELATLLLNVGYRDDLSLYYLGRAAEGLGYKSAADSYYGQSAFVSGTIEACAYKSRMCGGIGLPAAALQRRAAIYRELTGRPHRGLKATSAASHAPAPAEPEQTPAAQPTAKARRTETAESLRLAPLPAHPMAGP